MSTTLHAFKDYRCITVDGDDELEYIEDNGIDLCGSTWLEYIYPILDMATELSGSEIYIRCYDPYDSADIAKRRQIDVIDPMLFTSALELVRDSLLDRQDKVAKEMIYYLDEVLLPRTRAGLYLTEDRE